MALVTEYAFAEAQPGKDSVGSADLTLISSPAVPTGHTGGGLRVAVTPEGQSPGSPGVTGATTLMFWYKFDTYTGGRMVFFNNVWAILLSTADSKIYVYDLVTSTPATFTIPNNTSWHHVSVSWAPGNPVTVTVFVDGVVAGTPDIAGAGAANFSTPYDIGGGELGSGTNPVTLDDYRVFNETITNPSVVQDWMNTPGESAGPPDPASYANLTNADLELAYLKSLGGSGTLSDARAQVYGVNEHAYFAALSGLAPASRFSLSDHRLTYYRNETGVTGLSLADTARLFWADSLL